MDNKLTKQESRLAIKEGVLQALKKSKKSLSLLEISKVVDGVDRSIVRELERERLVKKLRHFEGNSNKTFSHKETKKVEKVKGTEIYTYKLVSNKEGK